MNSDLKDQRPFSLKKLLKSFRYAGQGIREAVKHEQNFRIHLMFSAVVISAGLILRVSAWEWIVILMLIGGMLSLELINTAVERVVDLVTENYHPLAKAAKDVSASAVLVYSILSVVVGLIIFLPRILAFFM
ncbi:diacylglycerol kinase family protein [Bacillus lacus]|uniref:Diacylglycerol kinase family protein n=1 Tax=Metabacillus lacus TaxID=1983721 RepID=A0A7X2IX96_9BACI|nr:diacylglycerol kinase family protein [Metabacillus lacus]MRX71304.1 diacylglycerol kinase family protein [Metabacillus lacus]